MHALLAGLVLMASVELFHWHDTTVSAPSAGGNLFDVIADVIWTHTDGTVRVGQAFYSGTGDDFVFRFGAEKLGDWTGVTSSAVTELNGLNIQHTVTALTNPNRSGYHVHQGDHPAWWMQQRGPEGRAVRIAPRLIMWATADKYWDDLSLLDAPTALWSGTYGFTGCHPEVHAAGWFDVTATPEGDQNFDLLTGTEGLDTRTFVALEAMIDRWLDVGGHVHLWEWSDFQRDGSAANLPGGANGTLSQRVDRHIAARLGPVPGWSMGHSFDCWENLDATMLAAWITRLNGWFGGWHHPLCARFIDTQVDGGAGGNQFDNCIDDVVRAGGYPACSVPWNQAVASPPQFASWEQWWPTIVDGAGNEHTTTDPQQIEDALRANTIAGRAFMSDRPQGSMDRFRTFTTPPSMGGNPKGFEADAEVPPVVRAYGHAGWAAIFGNTVNGHDVFPAEWSNPTAIKAANDEVTAAMDALPAPPRKLAVPSRLLGVL